MKRFITIILASMLVFGLPLNANASLWKEAIEAVFKLLGKYTDDAHRIGPGTVVAGKNALEQIQAGSEADVENCEATNILTVKRARANVYSYPSISNAISNIELRLGTGDQVCKLDWNGELLNKDLETFTSKGFESFYRVRGGFILKENFENE